MPKRLGTAVALEDFTAEGEIEVISCPVSPRKGTADLFHPWPGQPGWDISNPIAATSVAFCLLWGIQLVAGNTAKRQDEFLFLYASLTFSQ